MNPIPELATEPSIWVTILLINAAWPIIMAYAGYRVVLTFRRYRSFSETAEALVAGFGGVVAWWGRVIYGFDVPLDWPFALTLIGVALMLAPKLWGIVNYDHLMRYPNHPRRDQ